MSQLREVAARLDRQISQTVQQIKSLQERQSVLELQRRALDEPLSKLPADKAEPKASAAARPPKPAAS